MAEFLISLAVLVASLLVLYKSAEKSIVHAISIARISGLSEMAVGFVLISISTSLPELVVAITSALKGGVDVSVGNVFGANISDVTLIIGVVAVFSKVFVSRKEMKNLALILLGASLISLLLIVYHPDKLTGILLLLIFLGYVY